MTVYELIRELHNPACWGRLQQLIGWLSPQDVSHIGEVPPQLFDSSKCIFPNSQLCRAAIRYSRYYHYAEGSVLVRPFRTEAGESAWKDVVCTAHHHNKIMVFRKVLAQRTIQLCAQIIGDRYARQLVSDRFDSPEMFDGIPIKYIQPPQDAAESWLAATFSTSILALFYRFVEMIDEDEDIYVLFGDYDVFAALINKMYSAFAQVSYYICIKVLLGLL